MDFAYFMPTRVISGERCLMNQGALLKELGSKALIVTGARSARINGSLDDAVQTLERNAQTHAVFDKVMSNPSVQCVLNGAEAFLSEECDFVLAIGGGSPLDAGKAIALLAAQGKAVDAASIFKRTYTKARPVVAVPTTAGTGSEVTQYSILTNDIDETKTSIATPLIFPRLAFLDATYLRGLSYTVTVNTAIDALSHAIEGMLSIRASVMSDSLAGKSLEMIASCFASLSRNVLNDEERELLLQASTLAGMVIANTGTTAVHAMGYSLTYFKNIDHGRANGLLLPEFMAFTAQRKPERVSAVLSCMGLHSVPELASILDDLLGAREHLTAEECVRYAEKASKAGNIANCLVQPDTNDLIAMLNKALVSS